MQIIGFYVHSDIIRMSIKAGILYVIDNITLIIRKNEKKYLKRFCD